MTAPVSVPPLAPVGGLVLNDAPVAFNRGRATVTLKVRNTGDRPVQVGSHFHFFEANRALAFDRAAAFGMHLDLAASTALRFEPGDERTVTLVAYGGRQRVCGFNNLVDGAADAAAKPAAVERARERGFKST